MLDVDSNIFPLKEKFLNFQLVPLDVGVAYIGQQLCIHPDCSVLSSFLLELFFERKRLM